MTPAALRQAAFRQRRDARMAAYREALKQIIATNPSPKSDVAKRIKQLAEEALAWSPLTG